MLSAFMMAISLQAAPEPPDSVQVLIDNALRVETESGGFTVFFEADGGYSTDTGIIGSWAAEEGVFCVARATGETNCQPLLEDLGLGDSWQGEIATGETATFTLVARDRGT
ncbi:MAG: hypothetical protein KIS81_11145 [Maricaulaceae bacterium]|nr:hypothetical protein [Maricaulaceae bacterium]